MTRDELSERILATLEEAGEENIPTLMNTVVTSADVAPNVDDLQEALRELLQKRLARLATSAAPGQRLKELQQDVEENEIARLSDWLQYDTALRSWVDRRTSGPPYSDSYPYVKLTQAGRAASTRILSAKGYEWWRPRK
jgi:hypothetical protein